MSCIARRVAVLLAVVFALAPVAPALAGDSVVSSAELEQAIGARLQEDEAARATLRGLLARDEARAVAEQAGLDLQRAQSAVATLDGEELRQLAAQAATADATLAGGQTIQISLVAALLIVIIIILLVD